jgi:hypothetical protein
MFVQVIRSHTSDPDGVRERFDAWKEQLAPGATGFLGSTSGVTADGEVVTIARFSDESSARANSDRPEQGAWWAETEKLLDRPATFRESSDVTVLLGGGSDTAGFVQVMEGHITDRDALSALDPTAESFLRQHRPDLLGTVRVVCDDGSFTEAAYFSTEDAARSGELTPMPDEMAESFASYEALVHVADWLDLTDPMLLSA